MHVIDHIVQDCKTERLLQAFGDLNWSYHERNLAGS